MFKIFYDTLLKPKDIVNHVDSKSKGKFIGFIILLLLLYCLPYFIVQINGYNFSKEEAEDIAYYMLKEEPIDYAIKDGKLQYTGTEPVQVRSVRIDEGKILLADLPVYFVFSIDGTGYEVNKEKAYIVLFKEEEINIIYRPYIEASNKPNNDKVQLSNSIFGADMYPDEEVTTRILSYSDLDISLGYDKIEFKSEYYLSVFKIGSVLYNQIKWDYILDSVIFTILTNILSFFMNVLFTALILKLLFRYFGLGFKTVLKISILCSTIYVVGFVIAYLYNFELLALVCEFVSMIFTYKVMKQYAIMKMNRNTGGN